MSSNLRYLSQISELRRSIITSIRWWCSMRWMLVLASPVTGAIRLRNYTEDNIKIIIGSYVIPTILSYYHLLLEEHYVNISERNQRQLLIIGTVSYTPPSTLPGAWLAGSYIISHLKSRQYALQLRNKSIQPYSQCFVIFNRQNNIS